MSYTRIVVRCDPSFGEILIAELGQAGFDAFIETPEGFDGYAEENNFDGNGVESIRNKYAGTYDFSFTFERVEKKNWNEEWEKNYEPVIVGNQCIIRADFHQPKETYPYEIIITPKMSFGTGHHQTTYLMVLAQLELDHTRKSVMDAGSGTAVLSILASKLGAAHVYAFDIDEWSVLNGKENIEVNACHNITIHPGTIREQRFENAFDIILANINKNILLADMEALRDHLLRGGNMLISGFYSHDAPEILDRCAKLDLRLIRTYEKDNWVALLLSR